MRGRDAAVKLGPVARELLDNESWDFGTNCFVCEPKNERGLGIPFYVDRDEQRVYAEVTPETHHSGAPRFAHGGFNQALLDEGMAWAVIALGERFGITRRTETDFLTPVKLGRPHTIRCWVESRDGHDLIARGEIVDGRDEVCVSARASFYVLTREEAEAAIGSRTADTDRFTESARPGRS
jgi:acyl-coenzyme A thioesterase PaaI-like protein